MQQEVQMRITVTLSADVNADLDTLRHITAQALYKHLKYQPDSSVTLPIEIEMVEEAELYGNE